VRYIVELFCKKFAEEIRDGGMVCVVVVCETVVMSHLYISPVHFDKFGYYLSECLEVLCFFVLCSILGAF
jgi:hypothetical protein